MLKQWTVLMAVLLATGCGSDDSTKPGSPASGTGSTEGAPTKISVVLNWFPEMEHGGVFAADVEGVYAAQGLDVTIIPGGTEVRVVPRVATGQATFGITNADDVILGNAEGANVTALMAPMQISPRIIMVHADSGIESLADLKNMTLAMGTGAGFAQFVRKKFPLENVRIVPYPGSISVFLNDKNFAQQGYNISEPFLAKKNGGNPKNIFVADYGYNPYTSVLIVSRDYLEKNRDVVRRTVLATIKGWELYMADSKKADRAINVVNPEMDMESLAFGVAEMQDLVYTEDTKTKGMGTMNSERWRDLYNTMVDVELIKPDSVKIEDCYTLEFLPVK